MLAQEPPPTPTPETPAPPEGPPAALPRPAGAAAQPAEPQPYEKVITKDAKTHTGIFTVHQIKERYFYEIPKSELGKEFLWNTQIAKTTLGIGYGGGQLVNRVVRWELRGNRVLLRDINYSIAADPKEPIGKAVQAANNDTIVMSFAVAAFSKEGAPVIDVGRLFTTDVSEFSARQRLNATTFDASRTFIDRISPYPENVETEVTVTYTRNATPAGLNAPQVQIVGGMRPGSATVVLHHSMVKLPEKPMMARLFDERVGYFTTSAMNYSYDPYRAKQLRYIARWRLEKKDPTAALSEPVKPIVYYIDAATPTKLVPWVKKAVEDWQVAFEAAGFKNAIIAKPAPTEEEDPEFSPEDVRYSVIRWLPSTTENAQGPHISDPRTGEILNADIQVYHNVLNLIRDWYFVQVGPLDSRAQKLPLPDELMGRLIEFVIAHEVGHTLGFPHNMKASSLYPQEKVRDRDWVHRMSHTPSIMDYSRFNYVAQPEDKIEVADLVPRVGPYDIWAAKWGYTPIADAKTPNDEKATLDRWAREQDQTPWLRFSTANAAGSDPGDETEAVGDADAIQSTALGLKNLERVAKMLMPATAYRAGEPYDDMAEVYSRMLAQWTLEMNHVSAIVGGFDSQQKAVGQEGRIFTPVPKARQQAAVNFLVENAFATPKWMLDPEILRRIEPAGALSRVRNAQTAVLNNLLGSPRFARLIEQEAVDGSQVYTASDLLAAVRKGIWKELENPQVTIDAYRRNLQGAYLELVNT
ncbi:MAG: zinc-dependent metalloprotease, partial [Acidobacteriia bacterium]|nr:zinc-dependent metalloprotease [Terriglobia bacterium]